MAGKLLRKAERKLGRYAIPHLTEILVGGQLFFFFAIAGQAIQYEQMAFSPAKVMEGEWWRVIVFMFIPMTLSPLWLLFECYVLWLFGTALEANWGSFRYNLYILIAWVSSVAVAFIAPNGYATNEFAMLSILFAFAVLYPDFTLLIFFIIPAKVKWIALFYWLYIGFVFFEGEGFVQGVGQVNDPMLTRILILAAISNFLLFFHRDIFRAAKKAARKLIVTSETAAKSEEDTFHRCTVCGATDVSHPDREFRYIPECVCMDCIESGSAKDASAT